MSFSFVERQSDRPSRLLNLNKSPKLQNDIAKENSAKSPFLRLPPELRCRLYDHLFGSNAIHIRAHLIGRRGPSQNMLYRHTLALCNSPQQHNEVPRRFAEYLNPTRDSVPGCTIHEASTSTVTPQSIGLHLLLVSRQVYHEAVPKPFTEGSFYSLSHDRSKVKGLRPFVDASVPAQAQALAHLRVAIQCSYRGAPRDLFTEVQFGSIFGKGTVQKLTGLSDLQIVLAPLLALEQKASFFLTSFSIHFRDSPGVYSLIEQVLQSLRITMEAEFVDVDAQMLARRKHLSYLCWQK